MLATVNNKVYIVKFKYPKDGGLRKKSVCVIREKDSLVAYEGVAECSEKDTFSKVVGRKIAMSRALKKAGFDRDSRKAFWDQYFKECKG